MPRRRSGVRRRRARADDLSAIQREELLTGLDFSVLAHPHHGNGFDDDDEARRRAWFAHREELLQAWTADPPDQDHRGDLGQPLLGGAGSRPWAWWRYEAPESRRQVGGEGTPLDDTLFDFGIPRQWQALDGDDPPRFEDEAAYLERNGLLTDDEQGRESGPRQLWNDDPGAPVVAYLQAVRSGELTACEKIREACLRQVDDWWDGHQRGLFWDDERMRHMLRFADFLRHNKAEWAGKTVELFGWQAFAFGCLAGWMRGPRTRRFRRAFLLVSRKAGKSTVIGMVLSYLFLADGEEGAEILTVATDRSQAAIIFGEAEAFILRSPCLAPLITSKSSAAKEEDRYLFFGTNKFAPMGKPNWRQPQTGHNLHAAGVDELHEFPTDAPVTAVKTGMGSRRQPLLFMITTAGDGRQSPCYSEFLFARRILERLDKDDAYFTLIYELDGEIDLEGKGKKGDRWKDEAVWVKANPSYPVTPKPAYLRDIVREAENRPELCADLLRYSFNRWKTEGGQRWLDLRRWRACAGPVPAARLREDLRGEECLGALDLATIHDFNALTLFFPKTHHLLAWFWLPSLGLERAAERDQLPYLRWRDEEWITTTPGETIQQDRILSDLRGLMREYRVLEIAYDEWNAGWIVSQLMASGVTMVKVGRGFRDLSPAAKHFYTLITDGTLQHGDNPVLNLMAANARVETRIAKTAAQKYQGDVDQLTDGLDIRPVRGLTRHECVDGIVAGVMSMSRVIRQQPKRKSVYETRGFRTIQL